MLKTLFISSLALLAQANVHKFFAESNYICNLCELTVAKLSEGNTVDAMGVCQDSTGTQFTPICKMVFQQVQSIKLVGSESNGICKRLKLCSNFDDSEFAKQDAINETIIDLVNSDKNLKWTAGINERFKGWTLADVRRTLGTIVDSRLVYKLPLKTYDSVNALPTNFDAREQWPQCANLIGHVRDQSSCGCCWAFGSTESWNDRLCIADNNFQQLLSVEDTCSCCSGVSCGFSDGCNGGQPSAAWAWFTKTGVVTGGDYDDIGKVDTCSPFTLPPCAHHVNSTEYPPCPSTEYPTPKCEQRCNNTGYAKTWSEDLQYAAESYQLNTVNAIMQDIYDYGSTSAAFTVYEDFLSYTSGVYVHEYGQELGGHAIKIFGWGVENGQDYWLCANSWNDSWGDQGFFKILKGANECGIESDVTGGRAKST